MLMVSFVFCKNSPTTILFLSIKKVKEDKRVKLEKKKDYIYLMLALNIAMIMWKGKEMMVKNQIYCFHGEENATISMYNTALEAILIFFIFYT